MVGWVELGERGVSCLVVCFSALPPSFVESVLALDAARPTGADQTIENLICYQLNYVSF